MTVGQLKAQENQMGSERVHSEGGEKVTDSRSTSRRVYQAAWRQEHREELKLKARKYYAQNKDAIAERTRLRLLLDPEKIRANKKRHYQRRKEHIKARMRAYYRKNRERIGVRDRAYYRNNIDKIKAHVRQYEIKNREKVLASNRKKNRRYREGLSDLYVRKLLSYGTRVPIGAWPQELVEAKRAQMALKREMKR